MDVKKVTDLMLADAGRTATSLTKVYGVSKQAICNKMTRGFKSIDDLLILAEACGAHVNITLASGVVLPLTRTQQEQDAGTSGKE